MSWKCESKTPRGNLYLLWLSAHRTLAQKEFVFFALSIYILCYNFISSLSYLITARTLCRAWQADTQEKCANWIWAEVYCVDQRSQGGFCSADSAMAAPGSDSRSVYSLHLWSMHFQINGQKDSRISKETDNEREKFRSRVGVHSSLLRGLTAEVLAVPLLRFLLRMQGRNYNFYPWRK